jgi:predicted AAA+ superfamily ATPase
MLSRLLASLVGKASKSVLLLGPRQTGKSTLLGNLNPDWTINLADEGTFFRYSQDPGLLGEELDAQTPSSLILIDEIQRLPNLLNTVQASIDRKKSKHRFLLSGSSARKLKRGQANLLPGRLFGYELGGLCGAELAYAADLNQALRFGLLPEPYLGKNPAENQKLLETYSAVYLSEEIKEEALARDIQGFSRFLRAIAERAGTAIDFSKLSRQAGVSRATCTRFVEILEDTLVAHRVHSFQGADGADTVKHPKLYFFDVGVLNGLLRNFSVGAARRGPLFEALIYSQLRNSLLARDLPAEIFFFRTRNGVEVDFIVELRGEIWAIEVKAGAVDDHDLRGLVAFKDYYPKVKGLIAVGEVDRARRKNGVLICNWMTMLKEMGL